MHAGQVTLVARGAAPQQPPVQLLHETLVDVAVHPVHVLEKLPVRFAGAGAAHALHVSVPFTLLTQALVQLETVCLRPVVAVNCPALFLQPTCTCNAICCYCAGSYWSIRYWGCTILYTLRYTGQKDLR